MRLGGHVVAIGVVTDVIGRCLARHHRRRPLFAETVSVRVRVEVASELLVDVAVAVVVFPVAGLERARVDATALVVAVVAAGGAVAADVVGRPVSVVVTEPEGGGIAVFVDVRQVTHLGVAREAARVGVVAVVAAAAHRGVPVIVGVGAVPSAERGDFVAGGVTARRRPDQAPVLVGQRAARVAALLAIAIHGVIAVDVARAGRGRCIRTTDVDRRIVVPAGDARDHRRSQEPTLRHQQSPFIFVTRDLHRHRCVMTRVEKLGVHSKTLNEQLSTSRPVPPHGTAPPLLPTKPRLTTQELRR